MSKEKCTACDGHGYVETENLSKFNYDLLLKGIKEENIAKYLLNNSDGKVEIKHDLQAWDTNNVFIERSSRGKPSGITTTESDWWVFMISEVENQKYNKYIADVKDLKAFIGFPTESIRQVVKDWSASDVRGGDDMTSLGKLIPTIRLPFSKHAPFIPKPESHCFGCDGSDSAIGA